MNTLNGQYIFEFLTLEQAQFVIEQFINDFRQLLASPDTVLTFERIQSYKNSYLSRIMGICDLTKGLYASSYIARLSSIAYEFETSLMVS